VRGHGAYGEPVELNTSLKSAVVDSRATGEGGTRISD
jgi:hypothetical protein